MARVRVTSRLDEIAARALRDADIQLEQVAERVARNAKARAPRRTGRLAESITTERESATTVNVIADFPWFLIEHGTSRAGARPFMVPAAEQERDALRKAIGELFEP
jgi:HK97 gp10 family phage protein